MADTVSKIKERLTIVDVVQPYVKLIRAGKYWKGISPFTKEKTPSFFVSPDKGLYHCFSTGKGGDMFTFVSEMERTDFKGALKILAEKAGVELTYEPPEVRDERDQLFAALDEATRYYENQFASYEPVRAYLTERGVSEKSRERFRIGYAPRAWQGVTEHLRARGFSDALLERAGLAKRPDGEDGAISTRLYDRFRGRIMFPLFDVSGRIVAFSGRIFDDDPEHPGAKYLNSPEGPLFDKSRALYGIHVAKSGIRELNAALLVEGQVDLVLAHQAGYVNAVATSGTSFSASHAEMLKRYSSNVLIAYDGDRAGIAAAHRAAALLLGIGLEVKIVSLPSGSDPAELISRDVEAFKGAVRGALPVVDFFLREAARLTDSLQQKREVRRTVLPFLARMKGIDRSQAAHRVAEFLRIGDEAVLEEVGAYREDPLAETETSFAGTALEQLLFGILTTFEEAHDPRAGRIQELLLTRIGISGLDALRALPERESEALRIRASEIYFERYTGQAADTFLDELTKDSERERPHEWREYERLLAELKDAEAKGDTERANALTAAVTELSKKLG